MKKWTKEEIFNIGNWPIQGPLIEDKIRQMLTNQNQIIDYLERYNPTIFQIYQRSVGDDK